MKEQGTQTNYLFSNQDLKRLILPLLVEQLLAITVGMADSIMVSSVGEAAVSGVSLVDTIFVLLINIFTALATGGAVVCGQYLGKKRPEQACKAADQLVLATCGLSILVMALMYLLRTFILNVVFGHIEQDVWNNCNTYFLIVSASIPFISKSCSYLKGILYSPSFSAMRSSDLDLTLRPRDVVCFFCWGMYVLRRYGCEDHSFSFS